MNLDLYFIPLLASAFEQSDRVTALRAALVRIYRLGQIDELELGLSQFESFLWEAYSQQVPILLLERNGLVVEEFVACKTVKEARISGALPGTYALRLSTRRVLWTGVLERKDLFWTDAFPSAALPLAADSHPSAFPSTRHLKLLDGEISVRVYPGIESGTIGIQIDRWKQP